MKQDTKDRPQGGVEDILEGVVIEPSGVVHWSLLIPFSKPKDYTHFMSVATYLCHTGAIVDACLYHVYKVGERSIPRRASGAFNEKRKAIWVKLEAIGFRIVEMNLVISQDSHGVASNSDSLMGSSEQ